MDLTRDATPATDFALRTLAVVLLIGIAGGAAVARTVGAAGRDQLAFHAQFVVDTLATPALVDGTPVAEVLEDVVAMDPQVVAMSLLTPDREVQVTTRSRAAPDETTRHEIPLPAAGSGMLLAVEQDATDVAATTAGLTRRIAIVVAGGLLALWAVVVPLARRLGHRVARQNRTLERQRAQLARLLEQEQATVRRLREYDRLREQFLTSISHELRTPLTVVTGALRTLTAHGDRVPQDVRQDLLVRAGNHANRLDRLLVDLLSLTRSGAGPEHAHDLVDVREAVAEARRHAPACAVELELEVRALLTDRDQLVRALGALLSNAARHGPSDEVVTVRTIRAGTGVELQVEDRGAGISPELRRVVFEPFRQGDLRDAHAPGTGIGLALVAAYATSHGGRAWIDAAAGGGTRVHVRLPDAIGSAVAPVLQPRSAGATRPSVVLPRTVT